MFWTLIGGLNNEPFRIRLITFITGIATVIRSLSGFSPGHRDLHRPLEMRLNHKPAEIAQSFWEQTLRNYHGNRPALI